MSSFLDDPLHEDEKEVVKGLIHKYSNRALIKVSYRCAAHCRFCTRYRQIGNREGDLSDNDIKSIVRYLQSHQEINDIILSGGDPLYTPKRCLNLLEELEKIKSIKVLRIGTRLPIHSPLSFNSNLIHKVIAKAEQINKRIPFFILINIEHPDELTNETINIIRVLKQKGFSILSQTVFLKGINDSFDSLFYLFEKLYHIGVIPYYIYRCDYVKGIERFICDINREREIMTMLWNTLSGIACPTYVIDVSGHGKIPIPLNYWTETNVHNCRDFNGTEILI